jgi:hypothetical protein
VVLNGTTVWDIMVCSTFTISWRFIQIYRFHLYGRTTNPSKKAAWKKVTNRKYFLGLFFGREEGGDFFLWNSRWFSAGYTALPCRSKSSLRFLVPNWNVKNKCDEANRCWTTNSSRSDLEVASSKWRHVNRKGLGKCVSDVTVLGAAPPDERGLHASE